MKDDAIAPVVAFLLILMVLVSIFSLFNAYYIPSLKQQSEVEHLQMVEESFNDLSPKIYQLLLVWQNSSILESVPLGGGDVFLSPIRSSGYLGIEYNDSPLSTLTIENYPVSSNILIMNITYQPVGNYWINQIYNWTNGAVFIKKGKKTTSLLSVDDDEIEISSEEKQFFDMLLPKISYNIYGHNLTYLSLDLINMEKSDQSYINGNAFGTIIFDLYKSFESTKNLTRKTGENFQTIDLSGDSQNKYCIKESIDNAFQEISRKTNNSFISWNNQDFTITNNNIDPENLSFQVRIWNLSTKVK